MIELIEIINQRGETLSLDMNTSSEDHGLVVYNVVGLGPPIGTVAAKGGPNVDGTDISFISVDARHIELTLAVSPGMNEKVARAKINNFFPIKKPITLKLRVDTSLNLEQIAYVEKVEFNMFAKIENAVISLYLANPWFVSGGQLTPITYTGTTITYGGNVDMGVIVTILVTGLIEQADILTLVNTRGSTIQNMIFDLDGGLKRHFGPANLLVGDLLVIATRKKGKSVTLTRSSVQYNLLSAFQLTGSTWLTLGNVPQDDNIISYSISAYTGDETDLNVSVFHSEYHQGV